MSAASISRALRPKEATEFLREFIAAGGEVTVTKRNHMRWVTPGGTVLRSGLTMSPRSWMKDRKRIQQALEAERAAASGATG